MAKRIQLSRRAGWKMPADTVKVDRSTKWGNPFHTHGDGYPMSRPLAVWSFEQMLLKERSYIGRGKIVTVEDIKRELVGKNLACWCPLGEPCHADVLLRIADAN